MLDGRAVSLDVRLVPRPSRAWHEVSAQRLQRQVRMAPGAVATGARETILCVQSPQHPGNGAWEQSVLHCREAEWPHGALALGHRAPPHRRGLVVARCAALPKRLDARRKGGLTLLKALPVTTASALAVQRPPRVPKAHGRQDVCQRRKADGGMLLRFGGALSSCW